MLITIFELSSYLLNQIARCLQILELTMKFTNVNTA